MKKGGKLYCHGHSITNTNRISDSDSNLHFLFDSVNSINWTPAETFANLEHQDRNLFIQVVVEIIFSWLSWIFAINIRKCRLD